MEKISVVIITSNEERNIGRCINSVLPIADEILVLDSNSTDHTASIAESKGARVIIEPFSGYIDQKNKAVKLATHHFVLSLDADEALDARLTKSILQQKQKFQHKAYRMNRCTSYCGKFIRHGSWYPDTKTRLFDRRVAHWGGTNPHDKVILDDHISAIHLPGDILHYSYNSVSEHVLQNNKFSTVAAEAMYAKGQKTNLFNVFANPWWAFFQSYFIRAGFMDGLFGLVIAIQISHMTFLKHLKLYLLYKSAK